MSQQVNYAFVGALYSDEKAELYSELFFPALLYGLYLLFQDQRSNTNYYILENLQDKVYESLGVKIPLIVIKQVLPQIAKRFPDIKLSFLSKGDQFAIVKIWDVAFADSIIQKARTNETLFKKLESRFQDYSKRKHVPDTISFLSFLSNNLDRILQSDSDPTNNEIDGIHVAEFLKELEEIDADLFSFAADMYWASTIGAYLQRERVTLGSTERTITYYIDTAIALSVLGLDNLANEQYYSEMVNMIVQSRNKVMVHQFTVEEISSVLEGPWAPFSGISQAIARGKTKIQILKIKQELVRILSYHQISVEGYSQSLIFDAKEKLVKKFNTKELARLRHLENPSAREIHDIFMYKLISDKQGDEVSIEKCQAFFVTLNNEYEHFCKSLAPDKPPRVISPSDVILDVWMHSSVSSIEKKEILNEAITRCVALNRSDSVRKVSEVVRCYNDSTFTPEIYVALQDRVYARSRPVLDLLDAMDNSDSFIDKKKLAGQVLLKAQQEYSEKQDKESQAEIKRMEHERKMEQEKEEAIEKYEKELNVYKNKLDSLKKSIPDYVVKMGNWQEYQRDLTLFTKRKHIWKLILSGSLSLLYALVYLGLLVKCFDNDSVIWLKILPQWLSIIVTVILTAFPVIDLFCDRTGISFIHNLLSYLLNKDTSREDYKNKMIFKYKSKHPEPESPNIDFAELGK